MSAIIPPQAIDAEQAVLGAVMIRPDTLAKLSLSPDDFYRRDHRLIFRAILELDSKGQPFDAVTLGDWSAENGHSEEMSPAYLIDLAQNTFTASNVNAHAAIVREKATLRRVIDVAGRLTGSAFNGAESATLLDDAIRDLMALSKAEKGCEYSLRQTLSMAMDDVAEAVEHKGQIRGITTGYSRMDARLGGWHRGDLVFIGARPSMGKTALMMNLAANAAKAGHSVGIISAEQAAMQLGQRIISAESGVHAENLRNGDLNDEAWPRITRAMEDMYERKVRVYDRSAPTLDEVVRIARRWKQEHGMEVLFVDYLQRIRFPKAQNRIDEVSEVARGLKTLARDLDIPVICLAQVKAEVDKRNDKRPGLGDIANSDEATREADLIGFLYRDEVYNDESKGKGFAEVNVEKYRHGPTGQFDLHFNGATMRFSDGDSWGDW